MEVLAGVLAGRSLGLTTLSSVSRLSNPAALAIVPCHASPRDCDTACKSLSGGFSSRHGRVFRRLWVVGDHRDFWHRGTHVCRKFFEQDFIAENYGFVIRREHRRGNPEINERLNLEKAFWFSVYSLFAGEPIPEAPKTVEGKIVTVFIMFMGLTIFAMFTGTVSAFMIERFKSEGMVVASEDLEDHVVICGWNSKTEVIIREYRASASLKRVQIAVISEQEIDEAGVPEDLRNQISFIQDDFTRISALERAGISRAKTCIILADMGSGRSEQDADARTILAALTVEKISPQVYTCAELLNRQYGSHLSMGHVNDYVVSGDYSAYLLAQSSMNRGLMGVVGELLTYQHGQEFYRQPILPEWEGMSFSDLLLLLRNEHGAILVAVHTTEGAQKVNPKDHVFGEGDEIVIISDREIG